MWKDSETETDLLEFDYLIDITKDIIENDDLSPCTIGVYGDWGSGKSSLVEMILKDYKDNTDFLCLKFNGWLFEDYEDAKEALLGSILDKIKEKRTLTVKGKELIGKLFKNIDYFSIASKGLKFGTDLLFTGGIGTIADLTLTTILGKVKKAGAEVAESDIKKAMEGTFKKEEIRKNLRTFHTDFKKLLEETNIKKLVVFIDELDRCNHDTILETLEAIRLFVFATGTAFIIGADERQVMYAVRKRYPEVQGNQIDIGKEYLEKMVQYPIKIPQLGTAEVEYYITCLLFQDVFKTEYQRIINIIKQEKAKDFLKFKITYELIKRHFPKLDENLLKETLSLSLQLSSVLSKNLNGNPRHCKRFLNSFSMRLKMAEFKQITLDKRILAKLMLVEYFKDPVFKQLGLMQAEDNGELIEMEKIENDQWEEVDRLKVWKDDQWFRNWAQNGPKISRTDLSAYFYFSRESLQISRARTSASLSTEANKILKDLLSKSELGRKEALKKQSQLNDFESSEILKALFTELEQSTEIDKFHFASFIEWGEGNSSLHADVMGSLESLPVSKIKRPFSPRLASFAKKSDRVTEMKALAEIWAKDNPKLSELLLNDLK
ncbi:KAP family P-loop NTPase fold protein [Mucilaginibacter sp. NFX135]|uniref:KAP family P-loop NTPase fold protein n=1 Tax=Mucilaginibacter sp. NFX135 TaxID=3402687 RepID=UPI003AFB25AA